MSNQDTICGGLNSVFGSPTKEQLFERMKAGDDTVFKEHSWACYRLLNNYQIAELSAEMRALYYLNNDLCGESL